MSPAAQQAQADIAGRLQQEIQRPFVRECLFGSGVFGGGRELHGSLFEFGVCVHFHKQVFATVAQRGAHRCECQKLLHLFPLHKVFVIVRLILQPQVRAEGYDVYFVAFAFKTAVQCQGACGWTMCDIPREARV